MENASKALIIAGGVLLAMMILSLLVYVATSMTDMAESQDRITLAKQIKEFNDGYLAYNKTRLYGTDVITVVNKAINHNKTVEATEVDPYYINVKVLDNFETEIAISYEKEFKNSIFECQKVEYNEDGRINYMEFKQILND